MMTRLRHTSGSVGLPPLSAEEGADWVLAQEAPIAFLLNGTHFAVMMATPAALEDFALGFLLNEGVLPHRDALTEVRIIEMGEGYALNCQVAPAVAERAAERRRAFAGRAGCGICGAESIEMALPPLPHVRGPVPDDAAILRAFSALPMLQPLNAANRSTHAAAFASIDGTILAVREDVGRHNALDKLTGALVLGGQSARHGFVLVSSRLSIEMVQKATRMGTPLLASLSAPTDLARAKARASGLTIACRATGGLMRFNPTD